MHNDQDEMNNLLMQNAESPRVQKRNVRAGKKWKEVIVKFDDLIREHKQNISEKK